MKVDLILRNGWVFQTIRQRFEKMDIAVAGEKFYDISPVLPYEAECEVDCEGKYILPGLIDIHMHIESSMTYPREFSRTVLPFGVTTVVADAHEMANVFGMKGIKSFMDQETELDIFYGIPSSVPSTSPTLETSGGMIGEAEVKELLKDPRILCLGEVMNYKDLISPDKTLIQRIIDCCEENTRPVRLEGHCPALTGAALSAFIRAGVDAAHTQQTAESLVGQSDQGMFLELQAKSLTREVIEAVEAHSLYENVALVTDDTMPDHLADGQLNRIVRLAVKEGMPVEKAVYCSTYTPARRMQLYDRGMIAPGKIADLAVYDNLEEFSPVAVYKSGKRYRPEDHLYIEDEAGSLFPEEFRKTLFCREAREEDFTIVCEEKKSGRTHWQGKALVHVMEVQTFGTRMVHKKRWVPVKDGVLCWQEEGLCLAVVYERYGKTGSLSFGLIDKAFSRRGAVATTWSHDSHNLLVIGNSPEDMAMAQREVLYMQGGYGVASQGKITAKAPLPIGGIVSDQPISRLAEGLKEVRREIETLGYVDSNVIMSISTIGLLVSPELKLSDKGLVDVMSQEILPLVEETADQQA